MRRLVTALLVLVSTELPAQTLFERGPPEQRVVHRSLAALRVNPLGLVYDGRLGYRHRLYASESRALRDNFIGGGVTAVISPAYGKVGGYVEVAPASVLTLWGSLQLVGYFGSFDLLQSFPDATQDYSDDALERLGDTSYGATGLEMNVGADFQLRLGPALVRSRARLLTADLALRSGDAVFYDQILDVAFPDGGWAFTNDLDVAWMGHGNRLVVGVRYTATVPFHGDRADDTSTQRVGPLVAYTFRLRDGARLNAPTVFVLAQWWIDHRYRTGQQQSQALPLLGIGFSFYGDLLEM
jgi:hypothetical protein